MFDNYYIDHKTFNINTVLFFNWIKFCDYSLTTKYFLLTKLSILNNITFFCRSWRQSIFYLLFIKRKNGLVSLSKPKKIKQEKKDILLGNISKINYCCFLRKLKFLKQISLKVIIYDEIALSSSNKGRKKAIYCW